MAIEFFIGKRYFRAGQKKTSVSLITFLAVAGVAIGVMALTVVIAVMAGAKDDLQTRILNVNGHISLHSRYSSFSGWQEVVKTVEENPGVESATPFIAAAAVVWTAAENSAVGVQGVDLASAGRVVKYLDTAPLIAQSERRKADPGVNPGIVLGKELADNLALQVGDALLLISPGTSDSARYLKKAFNVVGLFESGLYDYDISLAFISLSDAQSLQGMGDEAAGIEIRIKDISRTAIIRQQIEDAVGYPFWAMDWTQKFESVFSLLELHKTVMFITLILIVMVAALNIVGALIMMVMEKKRDIAILRAMGATDRQVQGIFVFRGMSIGIVGTLLGDGLGLILCALLKRYKFVELPNDVYFFSTLPVKLQAMDMVLISTTTLAICFVAALYPSRQASRMNPIEAIRNP